MSKRRFSSEQIVDLRANGNVAMCSDKAITYGKDFKGRAVKEYRDEGAAAKQIFKEAGFDLNVIGKNKPKECLRRWCRVFKIKGINGLSTETRGRGGGRPRTKKLTDAKKIEYLQAKVAYLKAENDFLAKLRAKRAE